MNCKVSKYDICQLAQETWRDKKIVFPTFLNTDSDTFIYKVYRYTELIKELELISNSNVVLITDPELRVDNYTHELIWTRNGVSTVVFQGNVTVTDKPKTNGGGCGCNDKNKENIHVDFGDTVINVNIENIVPSNGGGSNLKSGEAINITNERVNVKVDGETIVINENNELEVITTGGISEIATSNEGNVELSGNGSIENPLSATVDLSSIIKPSPNIFDKEKAVRGSLILSNGTNNNSVNWVSVIIPIEPDKVYTLSGLLGSVVSTMARIFFYPASGNAIATATIMSDGTYDNITFKTPSNARRVGINIGTLANIGNTPTDNKYVDSMQLELGSKASEYSPYGSNFMPYVDNEIQNVYDYINQVIPSNSSLYQGIYSSKQPYPPTLTNYTDLGSNYIILWVDEKGRAYFKNSSKKVFYSDDSGVTYTLLYDFTSENLNVETVRDLDNGELIVVMQKSSQTGPRLYKSVGYNFGNNSGNITMQTLFTDPNAVGNINSRWGTHVYKNEILLSEYGNRGEARFVYYSDNYGNTFKQVFDLYDFANDSANAHVHSSSIDPYRGWLWITTGDLTNSGTYYSKDKGATWIAFENVNDAQRPGVPHQHVTNFPMPDCMCFLSDRTNLNVNPILPSGVYRIDIPSGDYNISNKNIKLSYRVDYSASLVQMGGNAFKNYHKPNQPTYFTFFRTSSGGGENISTALYATYDGKQIYKLWESPILPQSGGLFFVAGSDKNDNIFVHYVDENLVSKTIKFKSQTWE